jgi:hypothetical protein
LNDKEITGSAITLPQRAGYLVGVGNKDSLVCGKKFVSNRRCPCQSAIKTGDAQTIAQYNRGCPCQSTIKTRDAHTNANTIQDAPAKVQSKQGIPKPMHNTIDDTLSRVQSKHKKPLSM